MMIFVIALAVGMAFGALLQRAGASRPEHILGTLRLRDLTILKFMLLAIGVAAVGVGVLSAVGLAHLTIKPLYVWGVLLGGLVFGVGFAVSGYCPGTSLVACAEGRRDAWASVAGALVGAFAYTLVYPLIKPLLLDHQNLGELTVTNVTGAAPAIAGLIGGLFFIVVAFALPRYPVRNP